MPLKGNVTPNGNEGVEKNEVTKENDNKRK